MKQLLRTVFTCIPLACHGSDKLSEQKQQWQKQGAIVQKLTSCRGKEFLALVKEHDFLRAPRVMSDPVISICIRNEANPYPTEQVQQLLASGVDIDQEGTGGRTALHQAAQGLSIFSHHVVKGLLAHKADPVKQDSNGYNALGIALTSNRCDRSVLLLASHQNITRVVNQPLLIHTRWTTLLNALITTDNTPCIYRKDAIKKILDAGALISTQDIYDSLEPERAYGVVLKRCSLSQLMHALPLVVHHTYPSSLITFSKKKPLFQAIQEKIDQEMSNLTLHTPHKEYKQPPSYEGGYATPR